MLRYDLTPPKAAEKTKQLQTLATPIKENVLWVQMDADKQKMNLAWNDAPLTTQELMELLAQKPPKDSQSFKIRIANLHHFPEDSLRLLRDLLQNTTQQLNQTGK
jgi:hypothetical protein